MNSKPLDKLIVIGLVVMCCSFFHSFAVGANEDSGQKMEGFSVSNFDDNNRKSWDLAGDTLEIFGNDFRITNVKAKMYGKEDNMLLTADHGTYDKEVGSVHLNKNVTITSDSGAKMVTDTLDWFQKNQTVTTNDKVNIYRQDMTAQGVGAFGKTDLKQFSLNKDVQVDLLSQRQGETKKTTITCDGPLDIDYAKQIAIFNKNVKTDDGETQIFSDKMTGYFDNQTKKIKKIVATGNVKIVRGQDIAYSEEAIYNTEDQKVSLVGRPQLVIYSNKEGLGGKKTKE